MSVSSQSPHKMLSALVTGEGALTVPMVIIIVCIVKVDCMPVAEP